MKRAKKQGLTAKASVRKKLYKSIRILCIAALCAGLAAGAVLCVCSAHMKAVAAPCILSAETAGRDWDCILVLGCGVYNGKPSLILQDRLDKAIALYKAGVSDRLLMSGDHGSDDYNEVAVMKNYAVECGVPPEAVFLDHAGFSTYESMYRAKAVFGAKRILIVTQGYHLYRAVYDARALGLDAYGVASDPRDYPWMSAKYSRELLARCKDTLCCLVKPAVFVPDATVSLTGNGNDTNER